MVIRTLLSRTVLETIGERIKEILENHDALTTSEIFKTLRQETPNISPATVSGTLQRERQHGRVENRDGKWHTKSAPGASTPGALSIPYRGDQTGAE